MRGNLTLENWPSGEFCIGVAVRKVAMRWWKSVSQVSAEEGPGPAEVMGENLHRCRNKR